MGFSFTLPMSRMEPEVTSSPIQKEKMRAAWIGTTGSSFGPLLWLLSIFLYKEKPKHHNKVKCSPFKSRGKLMNNHVKIIVSLEDTEGIRKSEGCRWCLVHMFDKQLWTYLSADHHKKIIHELLPFIYIFCTSWGVCNMQMQTPPGSRNVIKLGQPASKVTAAVS